MPIVATLSITDEGLSYQYFANNTVKQVGFIKWSEIDSIDAFKRDMFSYDLICIQISGPKSAQSEPIEIDEEDPKWEAVMVALSKYLPQIKPWCEWFSAVAFPAFAINSLRIYERPN